MLLFLNFLKKKKKNETKPKQANVTSSKPKKTSEQVATRKGEIGEYKIDIQLDQLPKDCRYLSDLLVKNPKAKSGYSQIDHVVLTPYGIFAIETKNYQGTIYGGKDRKTWLINGKFKMMNPFVQNYGHIKALTSIIDEKYHDLFISMVSFTKRCTFKVDLDYRKIASNELIVYDIELSDFIHRKVSVLKLQYKKPLLNKQDVSDIYNAFSKANISDPEIREEHKQALQAKTTSDKITSPQATCSICNKAVSEKVKTYCLSNKKFNGKIYCFDHQKTVR
ncbi:nuclease-related domain-containing protein [Desertibacillus haloalkaliphilus]|uniref:nuclease-related domain-containing protein n=1 Tax=Desertibacillus haloalkaliphilus TaxID=1328930 RepID=UPI001C27A059|nr:nuclease-related domain-containing protein [Desertibacillus haloalkaliphilus]MBU8906532.1 NERD domain-containing protein [Desertibacillus haloalkaliphilus]